MYVHTGEVVLTGRNDHGKCAHATRRGDQLELTSWNVLERKQKMQPLVTSRSLFKARSDSRHARPGE